MPHPMHRMLSLFDDYATKGLYACTVGACFAFGLMLVAAGEHADDFLLLACVCMAASMLCLGFSTCVAVLESRDLPTPEPRVDV